MKQLSMFEAIEISLTKGCIALVDPIDSDLAEFKWAATSLTESPVYARRNIMGVRPLMHRVIMERILGRPLRKGEVPDHIDLNGLNNRRSNLRVATLSESAQNRKKQRNNTSGYKGVSWHKASQMWRARIGLENSSIYLGLFDTPEAAYAAYCEALKKYHGEFGREE